MNNYQENKNLDKIIVVIVFLIFLPLFSFAEVCYENCESCVDPEQEGDDIYTKGYIIFHETVTYYDECVKDTDIGKKLSYVSDDLFEKYCVENGAGSKRITCEFGCEDGACLKEPRILGVCIDEDGGSNYYERGIVESGEWKRVDTCLDITRGSVIECWGEDCVLEEWTCGDEAHPVKEEWYKCPVGCEEGACIECNGCISNEKCFDYGTILGNAYCDKTGKFLTLKALGVTCGEDYECQNNNCSNNKCSPSCDEGCLDESFKCVPFGSIVGDAYCGSDNSLRKQKEDSESCVANYECKSNICENNKCKSLNPFGKIDTRLIIIIIIFLVLTVSVFLFSRKIKQAQT